MLGKNITNAWEKKVNNNEIINVLLNKLYNYLDMMEMFKLCKYYLQIVNLTFLPPEAMWTIWFKGINMF